METFHSSDETLRDSDATLREPALPVPLTAQGVMEHVRKLLASRRSKPRQRRPVLEHLFESLEERRMLSIAPIAAEVSTMEAAAWNLSQEHEFRWLGGPDIDPQGNKYFKDKNFIYWIMTPSGELYFEQMYPGGLRGNFTPDYYDRIDELLFNAKEPLHAAVVDAVLGESSTIESAAPFQGAAVEQESLSNVIETLSAAGGGDQVTLSGEPIVVSETYDPGHPTRGHWTEYVLLKPGAGDSVTYRVSAKGRLELFLTSPDYPDRDPETEVRIFDGGKLIASVRVDMSKRATDETFDLPGGRKVPGYRLGEFEFQSEPAVSVESSRTGLWRGTGNLVVKQKEAAPHEPNEPNEPNEPLLLTIPLEVQQRACDLKELYGFTLDRSGVHDDPFGRVVGKTRDDEWVHITPDGTLFVAYEAVANLSPEYYTHALGLLIKAASLQSETVDLTPAPAPTEFPTLESEGPRESLRAFALQVTGMEKSRMDLRAIARKFNPQYFAEQPWQDREMFDAMAPQGENHTWSVEGMVGMQLEYLNDVQRGINAWNTMVAGALVEAYYAQLRATLGTEPLREDFVGFNLSGGVNRDAARAEKYVGLPHRGLIETMAAAYFPEIHRKHLELAGREVARHMNTEAKNGNGYEEDPAAPTRSEAAIEQHLRVLHEAHAADAGAYARAVDAYMASIGRKFQDLFSVDDVIVRREEVAAPGVNDAVGVWTPTFPRYYEILSPDTIAQIEADVAKYDPAQPLIVIFLGSNQRVEPEVHEESPGLLRLARRFSNEGIQVKVFTTGSNPTDLSNGRYDANVIPMGGDVPAKPYAERWLETFYQNVKIPGGLFTVGYSHGASRQVTVLDALLTKYPEVPILGSVNLDGVNDPFPGFPFWKSETEAPQNTQVHLDILEEAGSVWSFTVPYLNEEITLRVRTIRGAAARNLAPEIEHHILDIQNATHSDMDDHPAVHDTIYTFIHRALENAK